MYIVPDPPIFCSDIGPGPARCTPPALLINMSYHVPHQSQLNTQSSGLSPCTPSLLENPLTFFTNTHYPSQRYHLSFSTKKDCTFSCNTVVNIDVAPCLLVCLHYAWRRRKKGCDWCVVKVVTSLRVDRTCDACLHWHQYSLTSEFLKVPNIYI
jgi:hypothetical protein